MQKIIYTSLAAIAIFSFLKANSVFAGQISEADKEFQLLVTHQEISLGSAETVKLLIQPTETISNLQIDLPHTGIWSFVHEPEDIPLITQTMVITFSITPLVIGEWIPEVIIDYQENGKTNHQYIQANRTLSVNPVQEFILFDLITDQGTVEEGDDINVRLNINNLSPFSIYFNQVNGYGIDLDWDSFSENPIIHPGKDIISLTAHINGEHPQPQLYISYSWQDDLGETNSASTYIIGNEINYQTQFSLFDQIPVEILGIVIGLIAGSLSLLVNDWVTRRVKRNANCRQVLGMLQMVLLEVKHAATNGTEVRLELLETVIKTEELYRVLDHFDLVDDVKNLWDTTSKHNKGLDNPGGVQREKELRTVSDTLSLNLMRASKGWIAYAVQKRSNKCFSKSE